MCRVKLDQNLIISQFMDLPVGDLRLRISHSFFSICALCCLEGDDHKSQGLGNWLSNISNTHSCCKEQKHWCRCLSTSVNILVKRKSHCANKFFSKDEWNAHYMINEWMKKMEKINRLWSSITLYPSLGLIFLSFSSLSVVNVSSYRCSSPASPYVCLIFTFTYSMISWLTHLLLINHKFHYLSTLPVTISVRQVTLKKYLATQIMCATPKNNFCPL